MTFVFLQAYAIAFLEITFALVAIMLLHSMKGVIGDAAMYVGMGAMLVFGQVITAAGLVLDPQTETITGLSFSIGQAILFTPFMAALLITYIVDGTLEAQRLIWSMMAAVGIFTYLAFLAERQIDWEGYAVSFRPDLLGSLLHSSRRYIWASLLSLLIEFLALPMCYEIMRRFNLRLGLSVLAAFIFTQVLDAFCFELVTNLNSADWWDDLRRSYLARAIAMLWVACLTTVYLNLRDAAVRHETSPRRPLEIVIAFLGAYGQAQLLQANVRQWEGRYRVVVENSSDLIFIVAEDGTLLDANRTALSASGYRIDQLLHVNVQKLMKSGANWPRIWQRLFPDGAATVLPAEPGNVVVHECVMERQDGEQLILDVVFSPLALPQQSGALMVARDITRRKLLEKEREALREQLIHSQRMEAVGKLAGGIAHDFNNLLHAIQGGLENLNRRVALDPAATQTLHSINVAAERASTLTGQLLGFARGGKYEVTRIDLHDLLGETEGLFRAVLGQKVHFKTVLHPDPLFVEGDFTQLQQVVFNVLLNAKDALPAEGGRVVLRAEPAAEFTPGWDPARATGGPERYVIVRVRDNGCGMDLQTKARIFEPFFTTKETKGTGMGLAMAYGCIDNHHGWIHVETAVGKGSEFFIYLPRVA